MNRTIASFSDYCRHEILERLLQHFNSSHSSPPRQTTFEIYMFLSRHQTAVPTPYSLLLPKQQKSWSVVLANHKLWQVHYTVKKTSWFSHSYYGQAQLLHVHVQRKTRWFSLKLNHAHRLHVLLALWKTLERQGVKKRGFSTRLVQPMPPSRLRSLVLVKTRRANDGLHYYY
jgi:hypothetical protein